MYTYKVYMKRLTEDDYNGSWEYDVRFTMGDYMLNCYYMREIDEVRATLEETTLISKTPVNDDETWKDRDTIDLCRLRENYMTTPWFLSMVDARNAAIALNINPDKAIMDTGHLYQKQINIPQCPFEVNLELGPKGYFTKIEMHPDVMGPNGGKFYFPHYDSGDKVCTGPAIVHGMETKMNYGFIHVEMKQFGMPDRAMLMAHLAETAANAVNTTVAEMVTPFGKVVRVKTNKAVKILTSDPNAEEGAPSFYTADELVEHIAALRTDQFQIIIEKPIRDYICNAAYGMDEVPFTKEFVGCQFHFPEAEDDCENEDDALMQEVQSTLVIQRMLIGDIPYYSLIRRCLYEVAAKFSTEDVKRIIRIVNTTNTEANHEFVRRLKSGRIRLSL